MIFEKVRWCFSFLCLLCFSLTAGDVLRNGGFEQLNSQETFPLHWDAAKLAGVQGDITLDKAMVASGKHALRLHQTSTKGRMICAQRINLPKALKSPCEAVVSMRVSAENLDRSILVLSAGTWKQLQRQWVCLAQLKGTFGWRTLKKTMTIDAGTECLILSIRTGAPGMLWCDDVKLELHPALPKPGEELLRNGDLKGPAEKHTGLPAHWRMKMYDGLETVGTAKLAKDEGGNSMIQLQWQSGARRFGVESMMRPLSLGQGSVEVSALVKTAANGQATLAVDLLDDNGSLVDQIYSAPMTSDTWQKLTHRFSTTKSTAAMRVYCLSNEKGGVGFRQVSCKWLGKSTGASKLALSAEILPVSWNRYWNGGKNEFTTFADAPVPLSFAFKGRKVDLKNPELQIDLPAALSIGDAFCTHENVYRPEVWSTEPVKRVEGDYVRYRFKNLRAFQIIKPYNAWERKVALAIVPAIAKDKLAKSYRVFWRLMDHGQAGSEENFMLKLAEMPPAGRLPRDFRIMRWGQNDYFFANLDLLDKSLLLLERCGLNIGDFNNSNFDYMKKIINLQRKRGWKQTWSFGDVSNTRYYTPKMKEALSKRMEYRLGLQGLEKNFACPEFLTDDPQCRELLKEMIKTVVNNDNPKPGDLVSLDIEPWAPLEWCFCNRCRKNFAARFKLDHLPDAKEIRSKYVQEWTQFRCENTTKLIAVFGEVFKEDFPQLLLGDYDYIVDFRKPDYHILYQSVARDPEQIEKHIDLHLTSYYHVIGKEAFDLMRVNTRRLKKPCMPIGAIGGTNFLSPTEMLNPKQIRQMVLAAAVNGSVGYGVYPGRHLDGQMLLAFRRALDDIAVLEDYYKLGRNADASDVMVAARPYRTQEIQVGHEMRKLEFPNWRTHLASSAIPRGAERLITVFNYHPKKVMFADCKVELPEGDYTVCNPCTGKMYPTAQGKRVWKKADLQRGLLVEVPSLDVTFILVRPAKSDDASMPLELPRRELEAHFRQQVALNADGGQVRRQQVGTQSIQLSDYDSDGTPEVELGSDGLKLWVNYAQGGAITKMVCNGQEIASTWSIDQIWWPRKFRGAAGRKVEIKEAVIRNGQLRLVLEKNAEQLPLRIRKSFSMKAGSPVLTISYELTNVGQKSVNFSWWIKNMIDQKNKPILWNERKSTFQPIVDVLGQDTYHVGPEPSVGFKKWDENHQLSGQDSKLTSQFGEVIIRQKTGGLMNYYYWMATVLKTWEMMYKPITIEPGKSWKYELDYELKRN